MKARTTTSTRGRYARCIGAVMALILAFTVALGAPARPAHAAGQMILSNNGVVLVSLPGGGQLALSLQDVNVGAQFVRMRVGWIARTTQAFQLQLNGLPGGSVLGYDLNPSVFSPQPRQPDQVVLNIQPPEPIFNDSFVFELSDGLPQNGVLAQILVQNLTTGAQVTVNSIPIFYAPTATSSIIDLGNGALQTGGVTLTPGGQLVGGNGATVTGPFTAVPGSTIQVTQGTLTIGDGVSPVNINAYVQLLQDTKLQLRAPREADNSLAKMYLAGDIELRHAQIDARDQFASALVLGTTNMAGGAVALTSAISAAGGARLAEQQATQQQKLADYERLLTQQSLDQLQSATDLVKATIEQLRSIIQAQYDTNAAIMRIHSTLIGNIENLGALQIGGPRDIDHTDVAGNLTLRTGSQLEIELMGTSAGSFDSIGVTGNVTFEIGSVLKLGLLDPGDFANGTSLFDPQALNHFDVLTAAHITSAGIVLDAPALPGKAFAVGIYDNPNGTQTLRITVIPLSTTAPADTTPPVITPGIVGALGANGWYRSDVAVSWSVADPESAIASQTGCEPVTINTDTADVTVTCSATSAGGTSTLPVIIKRDATAPTLAPVVSPNPVNQGASATASSGAADALSGVASQSCGAPNTSAAGEKNVTCTAADNAGNSASADAVYTVVAVAVAPTVAIGPASNITPTGATLAGTVNANGADTTSIVFQVGTASGNYTQNVAAIPGQATGNSATNVQANLSSLAPNTTYFARLVATNAAGTTASTEITFRTAVRVTDFALFTLSNMTFASGGGNVAGRIAANGNLDTSRFNLGAGVTLPADTVIVNGNLSLANQNVRGNAIYGAALTRPNTVNFTGGAPIQRLNALETANTQAYVTALAAAWAALPANGTTTFQYGVLRLTGTNAAQNVFTVNGSNLSGASSVQISAPAGSTVIVNVSGASAQMRNMGISLSGVNRNRVVFNFYQAASLTISSASVPGLVWAPQAAVSLTNGNLTGSLVAQSLTGGSANVTHDAYLGALPR